MSIELTNLVADFDTQLASSASVGATTATLVSATDDDGVALPTGQYGLTIDAGSSSKEYIICTLTSTALTNIYSISRQGVATSGFARTHRRGAKVTITDWSAIKGIQNVLEVGYASAHTPTTDYELATKKYVDDAAIAGGTNASTTTQGFVQLATQAQVDAGTETGSTGAKLVATPNLTRAKNYNDYAVDSVGTDAYAISPSPAITAYAAGQIFTFKAGTANTGACTLNVSSLGAKTIKKNVSTDLATGDILANQIVTVVYDGTNFQIISAPSGLKDLANVTGVLPIANGGTGKSSLATLHTFGTTTLTNNSTVVVAHGLGSTPAYIVVKAKNPTGQGTTGPCVNSEGVYDGTTTKTLYEAYTNSGSGNMLSGLDSTYIVTLAVGGAGSSDWTVTMDATNITFTKVSYYATANVIWEAFAL